MNDLILTKMREGDWGAVVRLMRECGLTVVGDFANAADVAICLRRNADTGKCSYCMSRKVERSVT